MGDGETWFSTRRGGQGFLYLLMLWCVYLAEVGQSSLECFSVHSQHSTPWKINGWNLQIISNRQLRKENDLNQTSMIMFHVNLQGCTMVCWKPFLCLFFRCFLYGFRHGITPPKNDMSLEKVVVGRCIYFFWNGFLFRRHSFIFRGVIIICHHLFGEPPFDPHRTRGTSNSSSLLTKLPIGNPVFFFEGGI